MSVVLPSLLVIGFTGHRDLPDERASRARIVEVLKEKKASTSRTVCGLSSVAAGADLMFAEACMELGLPLRVLLPMAKDRFREDFDVPTWNRVEQALQYAVSVEVTSGGSVRDAAYYECGVQTVQQSDVLLALWDGELSRGLGGTEQVVSFAKAQGRTVYWIHSRTGVVEQFNRDVPPTDVELDFLNALPETEAPPRVETPKQLADAWFAKVDASASHASPQVRFLAAVPILCTAAASLLTAIGPLSGRTAIWLGVGSGLGLVALVLPELLNMNQRHVRWARIRTATEIARSHLALWNTPSSYNAIGPEIVPELSGMLASLNFLKLSAGASRRADIEDFRLRYRQDRLLGQIDYFSRHASRSDTRATQSKIVIVLSIVLAQAASVILVIEDMGSGTFVQGNWKLLLELAATLLFQSATVAGAVLVVNDYKRRRHRYREMESRLREWDRQIQAAQTWPVILQIAGMIERALLSEVIEWRSLIRGDKLPRNA